MNHTYQKIVSSDRLAYEIKLSSITAALDYITTGPSSVTIYFKAELSAQEIEVLESIITNHAPIPLPENKVQEVVVKQLPEAEPFAKPTFRTKRQGANSFITVLPGEEAIIDLPMTEERYAHGGILVYENARVGDRLFAEVVDANSVLPVSYRVQPICEAWPVVANYIDGEPVPPGNGFRDIDSYPLNARITPGLVLRVKYSACNKGEAREVGIGYYLTKRL